MSKTSYWDQIEQAFEKVDIYEGYEVFKEGAAKYPEWNIDLLAIHWTLSEIVNGGLAQYFSNSTAVLAPEAVLGLQRIGKIELAAALQKAMSMLGDPYPREHEMRRERLSALTGHQARSGEDFSIIPKWVAQKAGMEKSQNPFAEMDDLIIADADSVEAAMDEYAEAKLA